MILELLPVEGKPFVEFLLLGCPSQKCSRQLGKVLHAICRSIRLGFWPLWTMYLHCIVQTLFHGCIKALLNLLVFIAVLQHSVMIGMTELVHHESSNTPQINILSISWTIINLHTLVLVSTQTIFNQPLSIGMITTTNRRDWAYSWTKLDG